PSLWIPFASFPTCLVPSTTFWLDVLIHTRAPSPCFQLSSRTHRPSLSSSAVDLLLVLALDSTTASALSPTFQTPSGSLSACHLAVFFPTSLLFPMVP